MDGGQVGTDDLFHSLYMGTAEMIATWLEPRVATQSAVQMSSEWKVEATMRFAVYVCRMSHTHAGRIGT